MMLIAIPLNSDNGLRLTKVNIYDIIKKSKSVYQTTLPLSRQKGNLHSQEIKIYDNKLYN